MVLKQHQEMTVLANYLPFTANNLPLSISDFIKTNGIKLPIKMAFTQQQLSFDSCPSEQLNTAVELVLMDGSNIGQLINIANTINGQITGLSRCNKRAGTISYRFSLETTDIEQCKNKINELAIAHQFEAAVIANAPELAIPGLLVMDMDSTTIEIECIDEIAKLAGVGEQVSAVTERAMQGELDFAESLRERVGTLKGAPESILAQVADNLPLMPGLEVLIKELHKYQWKVAVASGGFTYFTEILKKQLNLDATQANVLEICNGRLTGKVVGDITDAQVKADTLLRLASEFNTAKGQTIAIGDGANDLAMLAVASLGVAYKAKPLVLQQAQTSINFSGLDCLLHWLK